LDTPASGIRATAGAALKWGLLGFGASATLFGILYTPFYGACVGLAVGTFTALRFGGFDIWSHFVLRGLLRWVGGVPTGVGAILAKAVRLGMLRQLGGGYMFAHRSLQQVLAKRSPTFVKE